MALEEPTWSILKLRQADFESRMNEYGKEVSGVGIVLNSPDNHMIPTPEPCSNNVAEYRLLAIMGCKSRRERSLWIGSMP